MRKISWLVAGINILLIIALMGCGYAKRDIVEAGLRDIAAQFFLKFPSLPEISSWTATL